MVRRGRGRIARCSGNLRLRLGQAEIIVVPPRSWSEWRGVFVLAGRVGVCRTVFGAGAGRGSSTRWEPAFAVRAGGNDRRSISEPVRVARGVRPWRGWALPRSRSDAGALEKLDTAGACVSGSGRPNCSSFHIEAGPRGTGRVSGRGGGACHASVGAVGVRGWPDQSLKSCEWIFAPFRRTARRACGWCGGLAGWLLAYQPLKSGEWIRAPLRRAA